MERTVGFGIDGCTRYVGFGQNFEENRAEDAAENPEVGLPFGAVDRFIS